MIPPRRLGGSALLLLLSACAAPPPENVSAEEWRAAQTRVFADTTVDKFDAAVRDVFNRSRPGEYVFEAAPDGLVARRSTRVFSSGLAQFTETWNLHYVQTPEGVRADIQLNANRAGTLAPDLNATPPNPSAYELFWRRAEFSLGARTHWWTCIEFYDLSPYRNFSYGLCGEDYV
jgi:hypothetical protein